MTAQKTVMLMWVTLSLKTLMTTNASHMSVKRARVHQKILSFAGLMSFSLTLHSNFQISSPC